MDQLAIETIEGLLGVPLVDPAAINPIDARELAAALIRLQEEVYESNPVVIDGRAYEAGMTMPIAPVMIGTCPICGKETVSEPIWNMEVWTGLKAAFQPSRAHESNCQAGKQIVWSVERW